MNRRQFLKSSGFTGSIVLVQPLASAADDRAIRLLKNSAFVNSSDPTTVGPLSGVLSGPNFNADYIAKLKQGGVTVVSSSMVFWLYDEIDVVSTRVHHFYRLIEQYHDDLHMVWSYSDIVAARMHGKIAMVMHAHTPSIIGGDLRRLEILYKLGVRVMGFSHHQSSLLAEGAGENIAEGDGGLTYFGIAALKEMNRLHMVADLGHASDESILQAARISEQPIMVSHTCCRALARHGEQSLRNISDNAIRAVAENNGVVGIMPLTSMLVAAGSGKKASLQLYVDHIEHVIDIAGIDYVGVGTEAGYGGSADDMKRVVPDTAERLGTNTPVMNIIKAVANQEPGTGFVVPGMEDMAHIKSNLINELIKRGHSDTEIEKILGLNFLRVYKTILST